MQSKAVHDKNATAPLFEKFLSEVYPDKDVRNWIQKLIGYSLTGSTKEQSLTMLLGSGSNGKGALFRVMQELLGDYMDVLPFSTFDASNKNDFSHDLADLKGVRLVLISETEQDRYLAEAKLKQVTGEDAIKARFLYQKFFTYRPQFKIIMAFNHKPKIRGRDDGIWRRLNVVPHTQSFLDPKNARDARKIKRLESEKKSWLKKDKDLEGKLNAELSGILNFAIEGLKMWQSEGLGAVPQAMAEANEEYEKEQDIFGQWMEESLVFGSGKASSKPMWESYRDWCEENNHHGLGSGRFYAELKDRLLESGCTLDRSSGKGSMYVGVSMKEEDSPWEQDETEQSADVLSFPSKSKRMAA